MAESEKKKKKKSHVILDPWKEEARRLLAKSLPLQSLFGFAAICGLVPLYALLAVRGRGQGPGDAATASGTHPQPLEAPALGADADVAAAPGHQGGLLGQSVGQRLRQARAGAQLAVAEARGGGPRPALLQGQGPWPHDGRRPPAPRLQAVAAQDDPLQLPQHLLADRLLQAHTQGEKECGQGGMREGGKGGEAGRLTD